MNSQIICNKFLKSDNNQFHTGSDLHLFDPMLTACLALQRNSWNIEKLIFVLFLCDLCEIFQLSDFIISELQWFGLQMGVLSADHMHDLPLHINSPLVIHSPWMWASVFHGVFVALYPTGQAQKQHRFKKKDSAFLSVLCQVMFILLWDQAFRWKQTIALFSRNVTHSWGDVCHAWLPLWRCCGEEQLFLSPHKYSTHIQGLPAVRECVFAWASVCCAYVGECPEAISCSLTHPTNI